MADLHRQLATPPPFPRRLVYLGTPQVAVKPLRALHAAGFDIALVVSRPDKRRGRGGALLPSPVKAAAIELDLAVTDRVDDALAVGADLGVVVAYGRLIQPHILDRIPMVNLHFSLLPRWRGAAPVERAILAGDATTGVCVMALEEGLDTGGIYAQASLDVDADADVESLRTRLVEMGTELLLGMLTNGIGDPTPQSGQATYAAKIEPGELELDFSRPAAEVLRVVRLGDAYTSFRGRRFKVVRARTRPGSGPPGELVDRVVIATPDGLVELLEVQPEGKGRLDAGAWANGARPQCGERFGS